MKNFKLLLATTAILSTCALSAMAVNTLNPGHYGTNVTITPTVDVITPLSVRSDEELYFGRLISPKNTETVVIHADADTTTGEATIDTSSTPHRGKLKVMNPIDTTKNSATRSFSFPNKIELYLDGSTKCGDVTDFELDNTVGSDVMEFYYGGKLKITNSNLSEGTCSGDGTVTIIYDVTSTSGGSPDPDI